MRPLLPVCCLAAALIPTSVPAQDHPRDGEIHEPDTLAWWHTTEALSNDSMEGRDTGTAAYGRAAEYVAERFAAAGLHPAGDNGTFFQTVPMQQVDITPEGTSFVVERPDGSRLQLQFLQEITTAPTSDMSWDASGKLTFRGYCGEDTMGDIQGKIVLCFGTQRQGLPTGAERRRKAAKGKAAGMVNVGDP